MRHISASYVFTGKGEFLKNGIIVLDNNNNISEIIDTSGTIKETPFLEYYNGIITPGFINAHCHLELSYLRNLFLKAQNLSGFIEQMLNKKKSYNKEIEESIERADYEMKSNGIVACGDISNTADSFQTKAKNNILYHTFIEVFGLDKNRTTHSFNKALETINQAQLQQIGSVSMVPHAAYSVEPNLFKAIVKSAKELNSILSIHNQESKEENMIFTEDTGSLAALLMKTGWKKESFPSTNLSSFASISDYLPKQNPILFVHNVFTSSQDILLAQQLFNNRYWVFCPKSNLFISNLLPDINLFRNETERICLGTDSLASNDTLSILEEMKALQSGFPELSLETLLQWSTLNGAKALGMDHLVGSFEKGNKSGVNLIYNLDLQNKQLTQATQVKVLA